jgi:hypothetical protein
MLKKMLVLALLSPAVGGCLVREREVPVQSEDRGGYGGRRHHYHEPAPPRSSHSHRDGCGHVFRGGIWIVVR